MGKNGNAKAFRIIRARPMAICIRNNYANDCCSAGKLSEVGFGKRNRSDNAETLGSLQSRGRKVDLTAGIESVPEREGGMDLMKFGRQHDEREDGGNERVRQGMASRVLYSL